MVGDSERRYLEQLVEPRLQPLDAKGYSHGAAALLHTFARFSYILSGQNVYWCIEWEPGLIVVRFAPDGAMAWCAIRSPIPDFGGRTPLQVDLEAFDEDAENHQYNLVFRAWDAQFSEQYRVWGGFVPASQETISAHSKALTLANSLGDELREMHSSSFEQWANECKSNIRRWAGEGIRLC